MEHGFSREPLEYGIYVNKTTLQTAIVNIGVSLKDYHENNYTEYYSFVEVIKKLRNPLKFERIR